MPHCRFKSPLANAARTARHIAVVLTILCAGRYGGAQDTPLLSGGVGFFTSTNGGNTTYTPIIEPLLAAPLGQHLLVESRAALVETISPGSNGYDFSHFIGLTYLQGDYIASRH